MTAILLATIVQTTMMATGVDATPVSSETYTEARRVTTETGKPLVVMVSTDWCQPCQAMKKNVLPRVQEHGLLKKVAFALINPDRESDLAEKVTGGGPVPQLVMFRKTSDGWVRKKLVGGQTVETVEEFISEGLDKDAATKKTTSDSSRQSPPSAKTSNHDEDTSDNTRHG